MEIPPAVADSGEEVDDLNLFLRASISASLLAIRVSYEMLISAICFRSDWISFGW